MRLILVERHAHTHTRRGETKSPDSPDSSSSGLWCPNSSSYQSSTPLSLHPAAAPFSASLNLSPSLIIPPTSPASLVPSYLPLPSNYRHLLSDLSHSLCLPVILNLQMHKHFFFPFPWNSHREEGRSEQQTEGTRGFYLHTHIFLASDSIFSVFFIRYGLLDVWLSVVRWKRETG